MGFLARVSLAAVGFEGVFLVVMLPGPLCSLAVWWDTYCSSLIDVYAKEHPEWSILVWRYLDIPSDPVFYASDLHEGLGSAHDVRFGAKGYGVWLGGGRRPAEVGLKFPCCLL